MSAENSASAPGTPLGHSPLPLVRLQTASDEMSASLYQPDAQRMIQVHFRPCDAAGKAFTAELPMRYTIQEVRDALQSGGRLASEFTSGNALPQDGSEDASPSSWWWPWPRRSSSSRNVHHASAAVHLFVDGTAFADREHDGLNGARERHAPDAVDDDDNDRVAARTDSERHLVAVPPDTTLEALHAALAHLSAALAGEAASLTLYYGKETAMGDEGALIALLVVALVGCCAALCCAAAAAVSEERAKKAEQQAAQQQQQQYQQQQQQGNEPAYYPQQQQQQSGGNFYAANSYGVPPAPGAPPPAQYGQPTWGQPVYGQPVYPSSSQPYQQYTYTANPYNNSPAPPPNQPQSTAAQNVQPL